MFNKQLSNVKQTYIRLDIIYNKLQIQKYNNLNHASYYPEVDNNLNVKENPLKQDVYTCNPIVPMGLYKKIRMAGS